MVPCEGVLEGQGLGMLCSGPLQEEKHMLVPRVCMHICITCPVAFTRCTSRSYMCHACATCHACALPTCHVCCMCLVTFTCHAMLAHITHVSQRETPGALGYLSAVVTGGTASFGGGNGECHPIAGGDPGGVQQREEEDGVAVAGDGVQLCWGHARVPVLGGSPLATGRGFAHRAC